MDLVFCFFHGKKIQQKFNKVMNNQSLKVMKEDQTEPRHRKQPKVRPRGLLYSMFQEPSCKTSLP